MKYIYPILIFILVISIIFLSILLWLYMHNKGIFSPSARAQGMQTVSPTQIIPPTEPIQIASVSSSLSPVSVMPSPVETISPEQLKQFFTLQHNTTKIIPVNLLFSHDRQITPFVEDQSISGYAISGEVTFTGPRAMARVLLGDSNGQELLVYEGFPLVEGSTAVYIHEWCEETCLMKHIIPSYLSVELNNATIHIEQLSINTHDIVLSQEKGMEIKKNQNEYKIKHINTHMQSQPYHWTAGHTKISELSYEDKRKLFTYKVPNMQGLEFYKEGVFEIPNELMSSVVSESVLPPSFDWRNIQGKNWITIAKQQEGCGSCWAFSATAVTEALINMYYNQDIDVDIAEQDAICAHPGSCLNGNYLHFAYDALQTTGLVTEDCFVNAGAEICSYKCSDASEKTWKIRGYGLVESDDESIKRAIIEKGPISFGVASYWHFMTAIGYDTAEDGSTIWYIKNSWGSTWGNDGVAQMVIPSYDRYGLIYAQKPYFSSDPDRYRIRCEDLDHDSYCSWGIAEEKPDTCSAGCLDEKDCDDTDPTKGPADENHWCVM